MGHRITQHIRVCSECGRTPEDGEYMWDMCGEWVCEECVNKEDDNDSINT
jgi:hypothetical protein